MEELDYIERALAELDEYFGVDPEADMVEYYEEMISNFSKEELEYHNEGEYPWMYAPEDTEEEGCDDEVDPLRDYNFPDEEDLFYDPWGKDED